MTNPYEVSEAQPTPTVRRKRGTQAVFLALLAFGSMVLVIFLKRGEIGPQDADNILVFILPIHLALAWFVTPSKMAFLPALFIIAVVAWIILSILEPLTIRLDGSLPAFGRTLFRVVLVNLCLVMGAAVFQLLSDRFFKRRSI